MIDDIRPSESLPTVSVIIAAYNVAQYIAAAVDSVVVQTFNSYEIIVVNDGSPDTPELERVLQPYQVRIRYIVQENRGFAGALNTGIGASAGRYIALLGPDDYWEKDLLSSQIALIESAPDIAVVYADARLFGNPREDGKRYMELFPSEGQVTIESLLSRQCNPQGSTVVIRRDVLQSLGGFDASLRSAEDLDLCLRIVRTGARIVYQRKVLAHYRRRSDSLSQDGVKHGLAIIQALTKFKSAYSLTPEELELVDRSMREVEAEKAWHLARRTLLAGNYTEACQPIGTAIPSTLS